MNDWEGSYTSGGGETAPEPKRGMSFGTQLSVLGVAVLVVGVFASVLAAQQSTDQRSRASGYSYSYPTPTPGSTSYTYTANSCLFFFFGCGSGTSYVTPTPAAKAPAITYLTPASGTSGTQVTLSGRGFSGATSVTFGNVPAAFTISSDTIIVAQAPANTGTVPVVVTTPIASSNTNAYFVYTGSSTVTPTYSPTAYLTSVPTSSVVPTGFPTPTATSPVPTGVTQPTATVAPGSTALALTVGLHGIGTGGDSVNPTADGNPSPTHPQRPVFVDVYNSQNQLVTSKQGVLTFDAASGKFTGTVVLDSGFTTGVYSIKVKTDQFLRTLVPGIQTVTAGQTNYLPAVTLVSGDINGDNTVSVLDYNILMGCYSDLLPPVDCTGDNARLSDLTDDGATNQYDYNFFLRELSTRSGQ